MASAGDAAGELQLVPANPHSIVLTETNEDGGRRRDKESLLEEHRDDGLEQDNKKYPKGIAFIMGNETCERYHCNHL